MMGSFDMGDEFNIPTFKKWCKQHGFQLDEKSTGSAKSFSEKEHTDKYKKLDSRAIVDEIYKQYKDNGYSFNKSNRSRGERPIFEFSRGAYFSGQLYYEIDSAGGRYYFKNRCCNDFYGMRNYAFELPVKELERLAEILEKAIDWDEEYKPESKWLDGYGWTLEFHHSNVNVFSSGYMAFPVNYCEVVLELQTFMEELCRKYADDYAEDGIEKRLSL